MSKKNFRVWYIINAPNDPEYIYVSTPEEGYKEIRREEKLQSRQWFVVDNVFGLEVLEDGEWSEWYDEQGNDVFEHFEQEEVACP